MIDILSLMQQDTELRYAASTKGGEYAGSCPWCGGKDRFRVWPESGRYWCRGCGQRGDAIQYLRDRRGMSFKDACATVGKEPGAYPDLQELQAMHTPSANVNAPSAQWQEAATVNYRQAYQALWSDEGIGALQYLRARGLSEAVIKDACLGYNTTTRFGPKQEWSTEKDVWLPRGIVIPWLYRQEVWRISIRAVGLDVPKDMRYIQASGGSNGLYRADSLSGDSQAVVLCEGEIDALSIVQSAGNAVAVVATGTTTGSRTDKWIARLARKPLVLVAFDADTAGDEAAKWWLSRLENAKRWRPLWSDANAMLQDRADIRAWINAALPTNQTLPVADASVNVSADYSKPPSRSDKEARSKWHHEHIDRIIKDNPQAEGETVKEYFGRIARLSMNSLEFILALESETHRK